MNRFQNKSMQQLYGLAQAQNVQKLYGPRRRVQHITQCAGSEPQLDDQMKQAAEFMKERTKDPEVRKAVQEQMQTQQQLMSHPAVVERMAKLKDDPEMTQFIEEMQKDGMKAMQKYWNDQEFLATVGSKLGDVLEIAQKDIMSGKVPGAPAGGITPQQQAAMDMQQQIMAHPAVAERMKQLRDDPDFADFFREVDVDSEAATKKYWNDQKFLQKMAAKVGDVMQIAQADILKKMREQGGGAAAAADAAAAATAAGPGGLEVNNLKQAAMVGDEEAIEDFLAIGKDVNETDDAKRTPLHYAMAHKQPKVVPTLLEAGADIGLVDVNGNTVLHYAVGYGCVEGVRALMKTDVDATLKNKTDKTALNLATLDPKNPVQNHKDIMDWLEEKCK